MVELHLSACGMLKCWVTGTCKCQVGLNTSMIGEVGRVGAMGDCASCDGLVGGSTVFEGGWLRVDCIRRCSSGPD